MNIAVDFYADGWAENIAQHGAIIESRLRSELPETVQEEEQPTYKTSDRH